MKQTEQTTPTKGTFMNSFNEIVTRSAAPQMPPALQIFFLCQGHGIQTALTLAAELGLADLMANGPRDSEELAQRTSTHPRSLYRLLRHLSSLGVFAEVQPGRFGLTPLSECLRGGRPGSMRSFVRMCGLKLWSPIYTEAMHSLRT